MSKLWLTLAIMVVSAVNAVAGNVLSLTGFDVLPGQSKEVSVVLENTDPVCGLQFEVKLPAGLSIWDYQKTSRTARHQLAHTQNGSSHLFILFDASNREIAAGKGAILTFTVYANSSYKLNTPLTVSGVLGANAQGENIVELEGADEEGKAEVKNEEIKFVVSADPVNVVEGSTTEVFLNLDNKQSSCSMMGARIILPEGMEIVPDEYGDLFAPTERTINHSVQGKKIGDREYTLLILSPVDPQNPDDVNFGGPVGGPVVKFTIKADKLMENAIIDVTNVNFSDYYSNSIKGDDAKIVVNVTPAQVIFFQDAQDIIKNAGDKYALVKLDDAANKAKIDAEVADLNAAVIAGEMTREEALAELEKVIKNMEQATGDVNLDGEFDVDDAQALFNAVLGTGNTEHLYDSNGDGDIDVDDAQYLFNKSLGL